LKEKNGWLWGNFFVVLDKVNRKKSAKKVFPLLKPDSPAYSPERFLTYNWELHLFNPKASLIGTPVFEEIKNMLEILGINLPEIVLERSKYLNDIQDDIKMKFSNFETEKTNLYQFFTAFEMSRKHFEKLQKPSFQ